MKNPIALNLTSEWGDAVNYADKHNARYRADQIKKESKLHQLLNKALCFAMVAASALILAFTDLLSIWVAVAVALPCLCAACFIGGRFWEKLR